MSSSNIFSIGEQDASDLLEEDLWEDFSKNEITFSSPKDDRKVNEENIPKGVNRSHQVPGPNHSSGFVKARQTTTLNVDTNKTLKKQDSKCQTLRPSASDSRQVQPFSYGPSFQSSVKDLPSSYSGSSSDGKRKCLANLANHGNSQFGAMVTQNREPVSKLPQKNFQSKFTAHAVAHTVPPSNVQTLGNKNDLAKTQPFRRKEFSAVRGDVMLRPAQVLQGSETTPSKGFQKFQAAAKTVTDRLVNSGIQGNNEKNTNDFKKLCFDKDIRDTSPLFSSRTDITAASQLSGRAAKEDQSLNGLRTASGSEDKSTLRFIPEPDRPCINGRSQLLPNREKLNHHGNNSIKPMSVNLSPPSSQFQKKRNSLGHTPLSSSNATRNLRPSSYTGQNQSSTGQNQSSTFQSYGSRGTTTPLSGSRPSWNSPRPGNMTPVNQSMRHRATNSAPCQQFPSPQLPVFTPRVAQLCKTPTGPRMGRQTRSSRKFPGPAGILPKLSPEQDLSNIKLSPPLEEEKEEKEVVPSSQDCGFDDFSQGAWNVMKTELELDEKDPKCLLAQHNIASVLRKASMKQLQRNKVPHICVLIKLITFHVNDAVVTLRDPTGEMQGTLHRGLIEEYQSDLKPGCVLLLKQVGVLSPSLRNHYLNVTHKNVVQIFPPEHISSQSSPSTQSKQRISPKSIKVNKFAEDDPPMKPVHSVESEELPTKSSKSLSMLNMSTDCEGEDEGGDSGHQSERKRLNVEGRGNKTKRICLELSGQESIHRHENVPSDSMSRNIESENTTQPEETIADLIEGFEDELFEDF